MARRILLIAGTGLNLTNGIGLRPRPDVIMRTE
jgi:hypothetical protein